VYRYDELLKERIEKRAETVAKETVDA
jgi:hypothetical protein